MSSHNRYAQDWNTYSKTWDVDYGSRHTHLGDEWNDDQTQERKRDLFYFRAYIERWVTPDMTVLEVGPGGGKWTIMIAPLVKRLIVLDVADEMLKRTRQRCQELGLTNVEYVLGNGENFQPVVSQSINFFFSHDVFVHIALEDTWPYTQEMARVLAPGGRGVCHYATNTTPVAWERIEQNNDWYRFGRHTLGQYYYFSPEALREMYAHCGLFMLEQHQEAWNHKCIFEKPAIAVVPRLEELLRQLVSAEANDNATRARLVSALQALPAELESHLKPILEQAKSEGDYYKRLHYAAQIRRIWRGA